MKSSVKILLGTLIIVIIAFFSIMIINSDDQEVTTQKTETTLQQEGTSEQPVAQNPTTLYLGDPAAPATIVEYIDYKCPNCNTFHRGVAQEITDQYVSSGRAKFEIRITPIIGPDSGRAGRGAYCANEQAIFPSYHDKVMDYMWDNFYEQNNFSTEFEDILTTDQLVSILQGTEFDEVSFRECVDSTKFNPQLDANLEAAADDGVRGTPSFVVGKQSFVGSQPYSVFKTLLDIELR